MKIQAALVAAASASIVLLASTGASAANLITNGAFSAGALSPWTLTGSVGDGQNTRVIDLQSGQAFGEFVPNDPNVASNYGLYFVSDVPLNAGATQNFTVTTAGKYTVSFDYYVPNNGLANQDDATLTASVNAAPVSTLDAKTLGNDNMTWRTVTATEYLTSGSNAFNFGFAVPGNVTAGVETSNNYAADFVVSNVSVSAVPEPATWAIMLVGFGGLGAAMRSRRKSAAVAA